MTARKKTDVKPPLEADPTLIDVDAIPPGDVAVMQLIDELGGDDQATVHIYRQGTSYKDLELISECAPEDFKPIMLAHPPYNGGTFRIHIRSKTGIIANKELKVARSATAETAEAKPPAQNDIMAMIMAMNAANNERMEKLLAAMRPAEPVNPLATLDGLKTMASVIKEMMPAPVQAPAAGGGMDFFTVLRASRELKEVMGGDKIPTDSDGNISESAMMFSALKDILLAAKGQPAPAAAAPVAQPAAAQIAAPVDQQPLSEDEQEMNFRLGLMRIELSRAVRQAETNGDVAAYGARLYDLLDESDITDMATQGTWFAKLCALEPRCQPHEIWFTAVRAEVIRLAQEDGILPADPAAAPPQP